ncbi:MAG TPA: hypothetical protein VJ227_04630 [Patescibacteria group bacterium]|nr:hypothetical protein [Patescibacteria group bacterium]
MEEYKQALLVLGIVLGIGQLALQVLTLKVRTKTAHLVKAAVAFMLMVSSVFVGNNLLVALWSALMVIHLASFVLVKEKSPNNHKARN